MAYKFQRGKATLSGSITAEDGLAGTLGVTDLDIDGAADIGADLVDGDLIVVDDGAAGANRKSELTRVKKYIFSALSGDATASDSGALTIAADSVEGTMLNTNAADGSTLELSSDSLSVLKVPNAITVDNATIQLNSGTTFDGSAARTISIKDGGVDADALAAAVAGDGLAGGGGSALSVQVSGAISINSDKLGIPRSVFGAGLKSGGPANFFQTLEVKASPDSFALSDANGLQLSASVAGSGIALAAGVLSVSIGELADLASGLHQDDDHLMINDAGTLKKMSFSNFEDEIFGNVSGDVAIAAGGAATIQDGAVESDMLNDNIISGQAALGGATVAQADLLLIDDGPGTVKKVTFSNFEDSIFGHVSGDIAIAAGGAATIQATSVEGSMLNSNTVNSTSFAIASNEIQLKSSVAGDGLALTSHVLSVNTSGALGVINDRVALSSSVAGDGLGFAGPVGAINSLKVNVDDSSIELNSDALRVKASGVTNDMLAGSIANGKLVNDGITIAGADTSLGGTISNFSVITGLDAAENDLTIFATQNANSTLTVGAASGKVKIAGDLQVVGTVETVNATELRVEDMLIVTARSASTNAAINGAGIQFGDGTNNQGGALLFKNDGTHGQLLDAVDGDHSGSIDIRAATFIGDLIGTVNADVANFAASTALRTLSPGINVFSSASVAQSASLPATPATGSVYHIKAEASCDSVRFLKIQSHASHTQLIDGEPHIILESPFAGVSLMYTGKNKFIIL
jgi:hypothetical protein